MTEIGMNYYVQMWFEHGKSENQHATIQAKCKQAVSPFLQASGHLMF